MSAFRKTAAGLAFEKNRVAIITTKEMRIPIVDKINAALLQAMKTPEVKSRFAAIGAEPIGSTPQQLAAHLAAETDKWGAIIKERGIRAD